TDLLNESARLVVLRSAEESRQCRDGYRSAIAISDAFSGVFGGSSDGPCPSSTRCWVARPASSSRGALCSPRVSMLPGGDTDTKKRHSVRPRVVNVAVLHPASVRQPLP